MPGMAGKSLGISDFSLSLFGNSSAILRRAQGEVLGLCNLLEEIADSLPDHLDRRKCQFAATTLEPLLFDVHNFEENSIFPMARSELKRLGAPSHCIDRLEAEHVEDQGFAGELASALEAAIVDSDFNADLLGYMLRGFFDSVRRHIAFERDYILVLIDPEWR